MTQEEFKAWFDGFCEGITGTPTEKQWKRIQARVKEIDGSRVTERIFIDRYDPYRYYPRWNEITCAVGTTYAATSAGDAPLWNSTSAMLALGKAEAAAL